MPKHRTAARAGFVAAAATAAVAAVLAAPLPATATGSAQLATGTARHATATAAAAPAEAARLAAGWLTRHLVGARHDHYVDVVSGTTYPDYGNTADAILGMDAAHVGQRAATRATRWLAGNVKGYISYACDATTTTYYPGAIAKTLLVAEAQRRNGHRFGGVNLIRRLARMETPAGQPDAGLYADPSACAYQSPITQALALIALSRTGSGASHPDRAAVRWLVGQQCANGGFVQDVRDTSTACTRSGESVDTTAYAAQALITVGARHAARSALHWLAGHQHADGSFGTAPVGANVNSTAVAAQALLAAHHRSRAARAQRWIASRQENCRAKPDRRGSLDYQHGYAGATTQLTATTQGTQALAGGVLGEISNAHAARSAPAYVCH